MESPRALTTAGLVEYYVPLGDTDSQSVPAVEPVLDSNGSALSLQLLGSSAPGSDGSCTITVARLPEASAHATGPCGHQRAREDGELWSAEHGAQEACEHRPCIWRCVIVMTFALLAAVGIVFYPLLQPHLPWTDDHALALAAFLAFLGILTSILLAGLIGSWPLSCSMCEEAPGKSSKQFISSADV